MPATLFDPLEPDFLRDPYPTYARLRRESPILRMPEGHVFVTRHADIEAATLRPEIYSSMLAAGAVPVREESGTLRSAGGSFIGMDPPIHTHVRGMVTEHYSRSSVADFEPTVRRIAGEVFDGLAGRGECELMADVAVAVPRRVLGRFMAIRDDQQGGFARWSDTDREPIHFKQAMENVGAMADFLGEVVSERRREKAPGDPIAAFVGAEERGELEQDHMYASIGLLLTSGTVETSHLIGNMVLALLTNPDQFEELRRDPSLLDAAVDETLRYDAPIQMLFRRTVEDTELGGERLASGTSMGLFVASANRDETVHDEPDRFLLRRSSRKQLSLGHGRHYCIGAALARLIARTALEHVLERLPNLRLASRAEELRRPSSFLIRGPLELPVRFDARASA